MPDPPDPPDPQKPTVGCPETLIIPDAICTVRRSNQTNMISPRAVPSPVSCYVRQRMWLLGRMSTGGKHAARRARTRVMMQIYGRSRGTVRIWRLACMAENEPNPRHNTVTCIPQTHRKPSRRPAQRNAICNPLGKMLLETHGMASQCARHVSYLKKKPCARYSQMR